MKPIVAYRRVSTARQGTSGLGLQAQEQALEAYAKSNEARILAAYTEVESGKVNDRPQLRAALLHAKRSKATLVVAKLDRLSRNAAFLLTLLESRVPLVCVDNPHANELTIGLLAVIAQHEARMISERTRSALRAAKSRGTKLGSARDGHWLGREERRLKGATEGTRRSAQVRARLAAEARNELAPIILGLREQGLTLEQMAERLNQEGWKTRQGKVWTGVYVCRILRQLDSHS